MLAFATKNSRSENPDRLHQIVRAFTDLRRGFNYIAGITRIVSITNYGFGRTECDAPVRYTTVNPNDRQLDHQENLAPQISLQPTALFLHRLRICSVFCHVVYQRVVLGFATVFAFLCRLPAPWYHRLSTTGSMRQDIRRPGQFLTSTAR